EGSDVRQFYSLSPYTIGRSSSHSYAEQIFFFQAEDGIRDGHVTGVQTCALPISNTPQNDRRPDDESGRCLSEQKFRVELTETISDDGFNGLRLLWSLLSRSRSLFFAGLL